MHAIKKVDGVGMMRLLLKELKGTDLCQCIIDTALVSRPLRMRHDLDHHRAGARTHKEGALLGVHSGLREQWCGQKKSDPLLGLLKEYLIEEIGACINCGCYCRFQNQTGPYCARRLRTRLWTRWAGRGERTGFRGRGLWRGLRGNEEEEAAAVGEAGAEVVVVDIVARSGCDVHNEGANRKAAAPGLW